MTTTDLADFGNRERLMLVEILTAWRQQGLPQDFVLQDVIPMMNTSSGWVFLTNGEYEVAMMNGDKLERLYRCGNCGHEGFKNEFICNDEDCSECKEE